MHRCLDRSWLLGWSRPPPLTSVPQRRRPACRARDSRRLVRKGTAERRGTAATALGYGLGVRSAANVLADDARHRSSSPCGAATPVHHKHYLVPVLGEIPARGFVPGTSRACPGSSAGVELWHSARRAEGKPLDRPGQRRLVLPEGDLQSDASCCERVPASKFEQRLLDDLGQRRMDVEDAGGHLVDGVPEAHRLDERLDED